MTQKSISKRWAQRGSHSNAINLSVIFSIKNFTLVTRKKLKCKKFFLISKIQVQDSRNKGANKFSYLLFRSSPNLKTLSKPYETFSRRTCERPQMSTSIMLLLPMFSQLIKCVAGDILPSLIRFKKCGSELKFLASIFHKLEKISI